MGSRPPLTAALPEAAGLAPAGALAAGGAALAEVAGLAEAGVETLMEAGLAAAELGDGAVLTTGALLAIGLGAAPRRMLPAALKGNPMSR
jgi:hypothetical protein